MPAKKAWRMVAAVVLVGALASPAWAQGTDGEGRGVVVGGRNFIHTVADMAKTVKFYEDVFGLKLTRPMGEPASNPAINQLTNTGQARFRAVAFDLPGADFDLELTEFTGVERNPGQSRMQDPGNSMLVLRVRDVDATLARAKAAGATIVTTGGQVLKRTNERTKTSNRAIFLRDPDGFMIEMEQFYPEQPTTAPAGSQVLTASIGMTAEDAEKTAEFWKHFGVDVHVNPRGPGNPTSMQLSATENAMFRGNPATIPGSTFRWTVFEFTGIPRTRFERRIQDPGAPAMSLMVRDLDEALKAVKASGATIVSAGGQPMRRANNQPGGNIFIRDPNGFLFELIQ
jgi:catechol 2,3-dioxygenase-like lactoylglutathione lyase family enzyme